MKSKLCYFLITSCILLCLSSCRTIPKGTNFNEIAKASVILGLDIEYKDNHQLYIESSKWIGTPYRGGGTTQRGIDCSGLTQQLYRSVYGKELSRSSNEQFKSAQKINKRKLTSGDLVFFSTDRSGKKVGHVGIYLKDGKFIHASSSSGVIVSKLSEPYYKRNWISGGKVLN